MPQNLNGKRIAILATDGVEQEELNEPRKALQQAGAKAEIISTRAGNIRGWNHTQWGDQIAVDKTTDQAKANDYDALFVPGGPMNSDMLRQDRKAVQFVKSFVETRKPVAAICQGTTMLVEAGVVRGRQITSSPSLQTDIRNAGGNWVDQQVVVDHGLITGRKAEDMPAFNRKMVEEIAAGIQAPV